MNLYDLNAMENDLSDEEETVSMTFEEYEEYKASCEEIIKKADAAANLSKNPDFISIIMEDYFTREPHRLGSLMASGKLNKAGFDGCAEDLAAIGNLRAFMSDFIAKGNIAREEIRQLEEARNESILQAETEGGTQ